MEGACQDIPQLLHSFIESITDLRTEFDKHTANSSVECVAPPTLELPPITGLETQFMSRASVILTAVEESSRYLIGRLYE